MKINPSKAPSTSNAQTSSEKEFFDALFSDNKIVEKKFHSKLRTVHAVFDLSNNKVYFREITGNGTKYLNKVA